MQGINCIGLILHYPNTGKIRTTSNLRSGCGSSSLVLVLLITDKIWLLLRVLNLYPLTLSTPLFYLPPPDLLITNPETDPSNKDN